MKNIFREIIFCLIFILIGLFGFIGISSAVCPSPKPAGMIICEDFEDNQYLDTYTHGSFPESAACVNITEESGNKFLTGRYDRADINCRNPHLNISLSRNQKEYFIKYRFRYSEDWNWNGGGAKFWRMAYCSPCSCEYVHGTPWGWPGFTKSSGSLGDVGYADYDQIRFPGAPTNFGQAPNNLGWFDYSAYIKFNNPGSAANGIFEMKVSNQKWSADTSAILGQAWNAIQFFSDTSCGFSNIELPGNVGGGTQPAPIGSWAIDDIEIWDRIPSTDIIPPAAPTGLTII